MFMRLNGQGRNQQLPEGAQAVMPAGTTSGLTAGTLVATPKGWRGVETISAGDEVMTFDGGMQRVQAVARSVLWGGDMECPGAYRPLHIPAGLLGNRRDMQVLPEQTVVLESDAAEAAFGDPFALVPAVALEGLPGVESLSPRGLIEVVQLSFEDDQLIYAEGSALVFCPSHVAGEPIDLAMLNTESALSSDYRVLSMHDARLLTTCVVAELSAVQGTARTA
ncbi:Hint domain-containing protein [Alphaproteobacteria bacterium KMM 3653]|uniref:Hint domain-containing protein n=1 Tax=Harenicola maris TaxID=2841044 RepID=A0AAP2G946_9RHOB|nr:Hint domain-containing protein [Harenicola maris]